MNQVPNPNEESFDEPTPAETQGDTKVGEVPTETTEEALPQEPTAAEMMAALTEATKTIKELEGQLRSKDGGEENVQSTDRRASETVTLKTIDGLPIIDMKLEDVTGVDHKGDKYIKGFKAHVMLPGETKPRIIPYGNQGDPDDYTQLKRKDFELVERDMGDKSGAHRIEHGVVVDRFGRVPEVDRTSGMPVRTGRMVEQVTTRDVRYYKIRLEDGQTIELAEDKLYR